MEEAKLVLEYFKVFLTAPVLFAVITMVFFFKFSKDIKSILSRVANIKLPGGTEVSTPQSNRIAEEEEKPTPQPSESPIQGLPKGLTPEQEKTTEQLIRSHIANTYLWEYRYLNYFLMRGTQEVLDWLVGIDKPVLFSLYDSYWLPLIPSVDERQAIISALEAHHLIVSDENNMITISPKGKEYQEWRGKLPSALKGNKT